MPRGRLFIVSAPSGGGKTSLTRALVPRLAQRGHEAVISVSYTTRPPRPGEADGVHYHFVGDGAFLDMVARGELLEHAEVFGRRYGTGRARTRALLEAGSDVILDIDWQGARQVKAAAPEAIGIFILPPSRAELERRLRGRGQDDEAVIARRMAQARAEMSHYDEYDFVIVNEDFDRALAALEGVFGDARDGEWSEASVHLRLAEQARRQEALLRELLAPAA